MAYLCLGVERRCVPLCIVRGRERTRAGVCLCCSSQPPRLHVVLLWSEKYVENTSVNTSVFETSILMFFFFRPTRLRSLKERLLVLSRSNFWFSRGATCVWCVGTINEVPPPSLALSAIAPPVPSCQARAVGDAPAPGCEQHCSRAGGRLVGDNFIRFLPTHGCASPGRCGTARTSTSDLYRYEERPSSSGVPLPGIFRCLRATKERTDIVASGRRIV